MANSLFDQLKKAGLVDEKKAKKAKKDKYQQAKQGKNKKKGQSGADNATKIAAQQAQQQKAERDRQLNLQRQQQQAEKANRAAVRQLIEANKLSDYDGELSFNFVDANKVKTLHVNPDTHQQLADGRLRVARFGTGYALLSKAAAEKIQQRDESVLIPLANDEASLSKEDQEHYAKFEVPDDLTW